MRIDCEHCGRALQIPDEKVPDRAFTLTCPSCQHKIQVDPRAGQAPSAEPAEVVQPPADPFPSATTETSTTAPSSAGPDQAALESTGSHAVGGLRALRATEVELLERITPIAVVVHVDAAPDPAIDPQLELLGMKEIQHVATIEEAVDRVEEFEAGLLVIRMNKAPAPPCEPLEALYLMPARARRKTFTTLVADNVRTLDGQVAFYLQVNCLVNAQEIAGMAVPLRRALLFHLKHYRHWWDTQEEN
ncbi:MAG: zinc-ribbon domain-containing protein [Thermoanaerobaculia bacterium]|nr:zinc-ribbon domain-containing protein [Thermoanaerobaculia bacterium]